MTARDLKFTNSRTGKRQKQLMRVVLSKFANFQQRGQTYYGLEGMSTSHLTLKVIEDLGALHAFWPAADQQYDPNHGNLYRLGDGTMRKVQSTVLAEIKKLVDKGYLEEKGNEHERRYRPVKELKGVTL